MESPGELWRRLCFLFQRPRFHREMEEELRFHIERKSEKYQANGMTPSEAKPAARVRLGNPGVVEARSWEVWGWNWLDQLAQDIRFACRGLIGNRAFSAIVVLTFACGIGVNTAIFSAVHALLLNPYPFPQSDRLVSVEARHISGKNSGAGWLDFRDWQRQNTVFESMAIFSWAGGYTLTGFGEPQHVNGAHTTAEYLHVLGVAPHLVAFLLQRKISLAPRSLSCCHMRSGRSDSRATPVCLAKQLRSKASNTRSSACFLDGSLCAAHPRVTSLLHCERTHRVATSISTT
jgi:hypothetical protein